MPPKTRAASAAKPTSASQPEPQRSTRTSARKRRNSDASNTSETPSSSQTKAPAKRRLSKKGKVTIEPEVEVILEESEDNMHEKDHVLSSTYDEVNDARNDSAEDEDDIQVSQTTSKHVHFDPEATANDDEGSFTEHVTTTNITPHLRKMTIKRRRSASPGQSTNKRVKSSRTSLPATLSQEEPTQTIQEHSFAPLRSVLDERIRRLSGLKNAAPHLAIDAQLNGAIDAEDEDVDDDMLVLDTHNEISVAQLPTAPNTPTPPPGGKARLAAATPGAHDRAQWAAEREEFRDAIVTLKREADDATSYLRILAIELESLDVAEKGAAALDVLQSIRDSFAQARQFLETELPGVLAEDATNRDLVQVLVANVQEFADRLRTADAELGEKGRLVNELGGQIHGLLDRLATGEIEKNVLRDEAVHLEQLFDEKDTEFVGLEEALLAAKEDKDAMKEQYNSEAARADSLEAEKSDLEENIDRLSVSLRQYQDEEARLTDKINNMEEEHRRTVTAMNREREEAIRDLEDRFDNTIVQTNEVEALAEARQEMIDELKTKIDEITAARDEIRDQLETATTQGDQEKERRETVEAELEEKDTEIEDLELRVRRLEDEVDEHAEQLAQLRQINENERNQREAAETELDSTWKKIEELNEKLHEQGTQANELRQKLFEVQTDNERKVRELETAASERDVQYQEQVATEVSRREEAAKFARERSETVELLEQQRKEVERVMRETLTERDERIDNLRQEAMRKDARAQDLADTLQSTEDDYAERSQQDQEQIEDLGRNVAMLQQTITTHENTIHVLEEEAHNMMQDNEIQTEERNAKIALLENELAELNVHKQDLETDKANLERKVQDEAEFLLIFQNEKNAEVEDLKHAIREKQNKIQTVEAKVHETDHRWQDLLAARDEEILNLTTTTEIQAASIDALKLRFRDYVYRSAGFIAHLQEQVDAAKLYVDEDGTALQADGEALLGELQGLDMPSGTKQKTKGKKRKYDSAIGMSPANVGVNLTSF